MKRAFFIIIFSLIFCVPLCSQTSSLTSGTITATNLFTQICPNGADRFFRFVGVNTDIGGLASPNFSGATMSECRVTCCKYGRGFVIDDVFIGNNNFRNNGSTILINGINYPNALFKGLLTVAGTVRVPFYYRKKQTATLTGKVNISGSLRVYMSPIDVTTDNYFYNKTFADPNATVTIQIEPINGDPRNFLVRSVQYNFVNPD